MQRVNDVWTQRARALGFPSRAMFKLLEANKKHRFLKQGHTVVDLGCAPGSWSKLASQIVGRNGEVYAVDINQLTEEELRVMGAYDKDEENMLKIEKRLQRSRSPVRFERADVTQWHPPRHLKRNVDVILSDMAPKTTGMCIAICYPSSLWLVSTRLALFRSVLLSYYFITLF